MANNCVTVGLFVFGNVTDVCTVAREEKITNCMNNVFKKMLHTAQRH